MFQSLELLDRALLLKVNSLHTPLLDQLMWILSQSWHTYLFVAIVAYLFYKKYNLKKAAEMLLGLALVIACTDLSANAIKHTVKRHRPTHNTEINSQVHLVNNYKGGTYGFFSSHAANGFGIVAYFFLCLNWMRTKTKFLFFIYPLLICYSRLYLGVHYPADLLCGAIDGLVFACIVYLIMNKYFLKLNEKI